MAVQRRTGFDRALAEAVTQATLATLGGRIPQQDAERLAAQLPAELRPWLKHASPLAERFSLEEFVSRVERRVAVLNQDEAEDAVAAVLVTLGEAMPEEEMRKVLGHLPEDMRALFRPRTAGRGK